MIKKFQSALRAGNKDVTNDMKQFDDALKMRNPDGHGLADIILIPNYKQTYCLKKWAASNLGNH